MFSKELNAKLDQYHLLKHPFYKSWNEGKLTREIIKDYAEQYYQHVKAFPRYISATHSLCEDIEKRKILLENQIFLVLQTFYLYHQTFLYQLYQPKQHNPH